MFLKKFKFQKHKLTSYKNFTFFGKSEFYIYILNGIILFN